MVSRILKKSPVKSIKDSRTKRRKRTKTPVKSAATFSSILSASIHTCHLRISKIFSKLTRIGGGTPVKKSPKKHGYKVLPRIPPGDTDFPCRSLHFCNDGGRLPLPKSEKRTIFLDLDETLIHSTPDPSNPFYDFIVQPVIDGVKVRFYVSKRPFVDQLLETLSQKYELVVFTAGLEEYASLVLDRLVDGKPVITHRLYRDSCRQVDGKFVKDLASTGRDLSRAVIVDDNPNSYLLQPENGIPIAAFTGEELVGDMELLRLIEFFEGCHRFEDMRDAVKEKQRDGWVSNVV